MALSPEFADRLQQAYSTAPQPVTHRTLLGPPGNPNSRFGWEIARRLQTPPPEIQRVGPEDVTPNRILSQMRGEQIFPQKPKIAAKSQSEIEYRKLKEEREQRKRTARAARRLQHK